MDDFLLAGENSEKTVIFQRNLLNSAMTGFSKGLKFSDFKSINLNLEFK